MGNKALNYKSCFDIIGPIMIGPSSSHTAGAVKMGRLARALFGGTPETLMCTYYESFAQTHKGHGTDYAILSGILGFDTNDLRVPQAEVIAKEKGISVTFIEKTGDSPIQHANTADLVLRTREHEVRLVAASVGGGSVEVRYIALEGIGLELTGPLPIIVLVTNDSVKTQQLCQLLSKHDVPILNMRLIERENTIVCGYELDGLLTDEIKAEVLLVMGERCYVLE